MDSNSMQSLCDAIRKHAIERADEIAYTLLRRDESIAEAVTFSDFYAKATAIACQLLEHISPGQRVLIAEDFNIRYLEMFAACLLSGVVAIPACPLRPGRKDLRLTGIIRDSSPAAVLFSDNNRDADWKQFLASIESSAVTISLPQDFTYCGKIQPPAVNHNALAYLQYTSGSITNPKGIALTHHSLAANLQTIAKAFRNTCDSIGVMWLPFYHDMGLVGTLQSLFVGFHCVLIPTQYVIASPAIWLRTISRYRATVSGGPDFAYRHCAQRCSETTLDTIDLSSWKVAFNGAEPVKLNTLTQFYDCFREAGFQSGAFFPCYGLAESTLYVSGEHFHPVKSVLTCERRAFEQNQINTKFPSIAETVSIVSCGAVTDDNGTEIRIVDPGSCMPIADGNIGEIWIFGKSVAEGVWNRERESVDDFRHRLPGSMPVYLRTGDLGVMINNQIFITGRSKEIIIVNGRNLYLHDIEAAAMSTEFPCCAAFEMRGESSPRLIVLTELRREMLHLLSADPTDVIPQCVESARERIWSNCGISAFEISVLLPGQIPRTSSGKIARHLCQERYLEQIGQGLLRFPAQRPSQPVTLNSSKEIQDRRTQ